MIEFRNVSKVYYNGTEALHDVNLKVSKGEFVFIVGASGAGKSTFLKLVMCEERPNTGNILIDGEDVSRIKKRRIPYIRRKMGMVFQDFRLIDHMTVYDNVAFAMRVVGASGRTIKKRVPYILGIVGLTKKAKCYPNELSGGERQRVGLARALVNNPSIIIADEPTGNIDPALSFEIVDLLNEINRMGTTILMVTHEHSLVKHFHRRIIQIHSGEIVADTGDQGFLRNEENDKSSGYNDVDPYDDIEGETEYGPSHVSSGEGADESYYEEDRPSAEPYEKPPVVTPTAAAAAVFDGIYDDDDGETDFDYGDDDEEDYFNAHGNFPAEMDVYDEDDDSDMDGYNYAPLFSDLTQEDINETT